jgi:uncharacterized protein (TIGR01777 family)
MKILIAGSSGLVGRALRPELSAAGHAVFQLVRPPQIPGKGQISWNPETGELNRHAAAGADAVVNLAGASIGEQRWSERHKELLRRSRIDSTRALVEAIGKHKPRPRVLVSASAVGYYGNRGDEELDEDSGPGEGYLAQLVVDWEAESLRAEELGIRTVLFRFGLILSARGGGLGQMVGPFRLGFGGRLGSGRQWMTWLALADAVGMVRAALEDEKWRGAYNAVAPQAVTNLEFTKALGHVLRRPTLLPVPIFVLRMIFGEMADEMILASQRARSKRLAETGYTYRYPELEPALREAITHS